MKSQQKPELKHIPSPEDKRNYVERMFTAIAPRYDLLNSLLSLGQDNRWRKKAAGHCQPDARIILDVATGTGRMASVLAVRPGVSRVVGLDFTKAMVLKGKTLLSNEKFAESINLVQGDIQDLPFAGDTFDCVTITYALRNLSDLERAFGEMVRAVRPGGRVVSLELTRPTQGFFRRIYFFYMRHVASVLGGLISGKKEAYQYLPDSIIIFPSPEEIKAIMEKAGLQGIVTKKLLGGIATIQMGTKCAV